ncbi:MULTISPECIES: hypothetical protein [unclassified Bradyrhizobium]|uniref:hypothetical protein n=1 Tax=unclassified Bradyrhizobium TaxID=2631580 RepID=UPI002FF2F6C1
MPNKSLRKRLTPPIRRTNPTRNGSRARASGLSQSCWSEAALLWPVRHYLFNLASELSKMGGEALVKLALPPILRASRDLFGKVSFGAQLLLHITPEKAATLEPKFLKWI